MLNRSTWWVIRVGVPPIVRRIEAHRRRLVVVSFIVVWAFMVGVFYTAPRHTIAPSGGNPFHGDAVASVVAGVLFALFAFVVGFAVAKRKFGGD
jgi:hypothetical protein